MRPTLLSDEYTPADMNPNYPKSSYKPTLNELEAYKRVYLNNSSRHADLMNQNSQFAVFDNRSEERDALA